jgi:transposase
VPRASIASRTPTALYAERLAINLQRDGGISKGRDFAAWLGLVPRQMSTGDRTILGKISKRGNRYLGVLFVQAAWVVLVKPRSWERHGLKPCLETARKRLHHNVLAIPLANKLARIAWSVLARGRVFARRSEGRHLRNLQGLAAACGAWRRNG